MSKFTTIALASTLALSLAACGEAEEPVVDNDLASEQVVGTSEYDPMTRDYALSEAATERRAGFDADAFQTEYAGYRDEIVGEPDDEGTYESDDGTATVSVEGDGNAQVNANGEAIQPIGPRDANTNMRARKDMTWGYLDRNDDNRLSVAEYAIWAIPLNPNAPARNDETAPFLTADEANKAADSFFYYDLDGDTYLDRREFTAARRGENFDS